MVSMNLTEAQEHALIGAVHLALDGEEHNQISSGYTHRPQTLKALVRLGLTTIDPAQARYTVRFVTLNDKGREIGRRLFQERYGMTPEQYHQKQVEEEAQEEAEERLEEERRNARIRTVVEAFRGIMVQPFGNANFPLDDVDLADEMERYFIDSRSTVVPLRLEHVEAIAKALQS